MLDQGQAMQVKDNQCKLKDKQRHFKVKQKLINFVRRANALIQTFLLILVIP